MLAYVKRKRDFITVAAAEAVSWEVPLASIEDDVGNIVLYGDSVTRGHEGDFLLMDGHIWLIDQVAPEDHQTTVTVADIRCAFDRKLPYTQGGTSIGEWLEEQFVGHYKSVADPVYTMPYLQIENTDVTAFLPPNVEDGLYTLKAYMRKINRLRDVQVSFSVEQDALCVRIERRMRPSHNILFDDGTNQLLSRSYSRSSIAKVTAYRNGVGTDFYMGKDGYITSMIPFDRAEGAWEVLSLTEDDDMEARVQDVFSQNANSHKIEWKGHHAYSLYDTTHFRLDGGVMNSYVSYIGISSGDTRFHYKSGELATTLTERLKGAKI